MIRRHGTSLPPECPMKGETTMLVKAKWNVKGSDGWHMAGEVFATEEDYGDAVEVLDAPKAAPVNEPEAEAVKAEEEPEAKPAAKNASRRRTNK